MENIPLLVAKVTQVTSDAPDGKIFVENPLISPDEPVYYAGPPNMFAVPGKGEYVMVVCAYIKKNQKSYYWINQVAQPSILGLDKETTPHSTTDVSKYPEVIEGQDANTQGRALNVFGQVPPDAYTKEHGVPAVVQLRDKKGARLRMNSKGSEGGGNYVELKTASGKKLLMEDNPPGFPSGPNPRKFPNKITGEIDKVEPSKSRILLSDRNNNRVQIDEFTDSVEVHAKNQAQLTTEGGLIDIGIKNIKNSCGTVNVNNRTEAGSINIESSRGTVSTFGQAGFDFLATTNPTAPVGAGIVADTAEVITTPGSEQLVPTDPSLFLGCGVLVNPINAKPLTEGALTFQTFTPLGVQIQSLLGEFTSTFLTQSHSATTEYSVTSPVINLEGIVNIGGAISMASTAAITGQTTFNGDTEFNGLQSFTGASTFTGVVTVDSGTVVNFVGHPTVSLGLRSILGVDIHTCPTISVDGKPILVLG